jgi:hypothetical protein
MWKSCQFMPLTAASTHHLAMQLAFTKLAWNWMIRKEDRSNAGLD